MARPARRATATASAPLTRHASIAASVSAAGHPTPAIGSGVIVVLNAVLMAI